MNTGDTARAWLGRLRGIVLKRLAGRFSPEATRDFLMLLEQQGKVPAALAGELLAGRCARDQLPEGALRRLVGVLYEDDRHRRVFVDELKEHIKARHVDINDMPFDLPVDGELAFENLSGLFANTSLDEFIITMNVRQSAYLFGLIRRMRCRKIIEIGRQWGGSTLLIAAAMKGTGRFWSIDDPTRLDYDIRVRGRRLDSPVEHQVEEACRRLGLKADIIVGDARTVDVDTGEVDLVFIDGDHSFDAAMSDFERFGLRVRVGGAVLFDDAVYDEFSEPGHTADVKRVVEEVTRRDDFRLARTVKRLVHFERVRK